MFTGLREQLSPAITAAATLMMALSILLLIVANLLVIADCLRGPDHL